ncbi:MAG: energy transducer TonB [Acidobacteria bacterium]|nr:energy transducer TonB [Acidobacteriota bacterium]
MPDVYSARDIAAAARVAETWVTHLIARGEIRSIGAQLPAAPPPAPHLFRFVAHDEAVRAVRALAAGLPVALPASPGAMGRDLFGSAAAEARPASLPLAVSTSLHGVIAAGILFISTLGLSATPESAPEPLPEPTPVRMVYLALPGPGGGGGGGGLKMKAPPAKAERNGESAVSSPIPARRLPPPVETPPPPKPEPPPPPLDAKTLPPVMAPVVTRPADNADREGVVTAPEQPVPSAGPGAGGGAGTGRGTGLGEGDGSGIGDGSGGGTGGGPYRPGSGVEPPRLLREVRAEYTDVARRSNLQGEVVMEIVIRRDGTVGDIRIMKGLGLGLNDQAIAAVRQWRFAPGRLKGSPVDVVVEVAVEFRLR